MSLKGQVFLKAELSPFVDEGGLVQKGWIPRKFYKLFGVETEKIIEEINKELAA